MTESREKGYIFALDKELMQELVAAQIKQLGFQTETTEMKFYKIASFGIGVVALFLILAGLVMILFTGNLIFALRGYPDAVAYLTVYSSGTVIGVVLLYVVYRFARKVDMLSRQTSAKP